MKNYLISVIIPIYNNKRYMRSILDSVLNQTYQNLEIICIDDISTDETPMILNEYATKDKRVKVIIRTTKAGLPTPSIQLALKYASGDYFFYMSQDDLIDSDLFEKSINKINDTGADIVSNKMVWYYEGETNNSIIDIPCNDDKYSISGREAFSKIIFHQISAFALVKMDLVKEIGYDTLFFDSCDYANKKQFLHSKKVVFIDSCFYYRQDNQDAVTKRFKPYQIELLNTCCRVCNDLIDNNYDKSLINNYIEHIFSTYKWLLSNIKKSRSTFNNEQYIQSKDKFKNVDIILLKFIVKNTPLKIFKLIKIILKQKLLFLILRTKQH